MEILMAIYHFHARIIKRSVGRSVVAAAAWQNACRLFDARIGLVSDYTEQRQIGFSQILLPKDAPDNLADRETLWNAVESAEARIDAQLARQIDVALPDEFDLSESIDALRNFSTKALLDGFPADLTIIEHDDETGNQHRHGYILIPTRPIIDGAFGQKRRDWNGRQKLSELREAWADTLNNSLAASGFAARVDHRSNKDRGIETQPEDHIGIIPRQIARRQQQAG